MTSDFEGLSNALIEAMMMGLPCITTDCAGSDEIIDNGESGIIINRGDVYALTDAMNKLIDNRQLAEQYAAEPQGRDEARFNPYARNGKMLFVGYKGKIRMIMCSNK